MSEGQAGNEHWAVVEFLDYEPFDQVGTMKVVDWDHTQEKAEAKLKTLQEELAKAKERGGGGAAETQERGVMVVFPRPFLREPVKDEVLTIPPGLSQDLDQATERRREEGRQRGEFCCDMDEPTLAEEAEKGWRRARTKEEREKDEETAKEMSRQEVVDFEEYRRLRGR